jgi:hypothetical protein
MRLSLHPSLGNNSILASIQHGTVEECNTRLCIPEHDSFMTEQSDSDSEATDSDYGTDANNTKPQRRLDVQSKLNEAFSSGDTPTGEDREPLLSNAPWPMNAGARLSVSSKLPRIVWSHKSAASIRKNNTTVANLKAVPLELFYRYSSSGGDGDYDRKFKSMQSGQ